MKTQLFRTAKWSLHPKIKLLSAVRRELLATPGSILDYPGSAGKFDSQLVSQALNGSKNHSNGLLLCEIASLYGHRGVVELGTNLGISSAYLTIGARSKSPNARIITGDISGKRLNFAREVHRKLELDNIEYIEGDFLNTAEVLFTAINGWGLAFIDGDHTYKGTMRYYSLSVQTGLPKSVVVFDDIAWSEEMKIAWKEISALHSSKFQVIGDMGLIYL